MFTFFLCFYFSIVQSDDKRMMISVWPPSIYLHYST